MRVTFFPELLFLLVFCKLALEFFDPAGLSSVFCLGTVELILEPGQCVEMLLGKLFLLLPDAVWASPVKYPVWLTFLAGTIKVASVHGWIQQIILTKNVPTWRVLNWLSTLLQYAPFDGLVWLWLLTLVSGGEIVAVHCPIFHHKMINNYGGQQFDYFYIFFYSTKLT